MPIVKFLARRASHVRQPQYMIEKDKYLAEGLRLFGRLCPVSFTFGVRPSDILVALATGSSIVRRPRYDCGGHALAAWTEAARTPQSSMQVGAVPDKNYSRVKYGVNMICASDRRASAEPDLATVRTMDLSDEQGQRSIQLQIDG